MTLHRLAAAALLALIALQPGWVAAAEREITPISGDVWRFRNDNHYSVFVVTADGVVVTDPIDHDAAWWLEGQIGQRFGKPIKYLIYSHSHGDHASGGSAFADTAEVIAHVNAPEKIDGVAIDRRISEPTVIETGGKTLELTPLAPGHGTDMMVMVIRPENVAFVVDVVNPGRLPYKDFPGADIGGLLNQIRSVERLQFDILAPGHGRLGTMADVVQAREYLEWLMASVQLQLDKLRDVDAIVRTLDTSQWAGMEAYDQWRELNIRGMARWLKENAKKP